VRVGALPHQFLGTVSWRLTEVAWDYIFNQMVKYSETALDTVFSALGDTTRRAILAQLAEGDCRVTELAAPHDMSLPAVSKHLRVLENAGLLKKQKDGRVIRCSLDFDALKSAADWVDQYRRFWDGQLDQLARYLEKTKPSEGKADE
jgi:DNA-binding transcriptional ArsR family regulator